MMIRILRGVKGRKGQSSVETAFALLIAIAFFLFIWEGISFGYSWVTMQFVLTRALQDVRTDKSFGFIRDSIMKNAEDFNLEGMKEPEFQTNFEWYQGTRGMVRIALEREIKFGFFMSKIFPGSSGTVPVRVSGYAERPPSV